MNNVTEREGGGDGCPPFLGSVLHKELVLGWGCSVLYVMCAYKNTSHCTDVPIHMLYVSETMYIPLR